MLIFHAYINEMHGSRSKIPSKNLVKQRCAEGFNFGVKKLKVINKIKIYIKLKPVDEEAGCFLKTCSKWLVNKDITRPVAIMTTQIICTLQVYPIAGGWIRPCNEHNFSPHVFCSDSEVCMNVIWKI
jgi:hypothetical protein